MQITQNDVRAIQLAKAALYAGVALLMERLGVDHVDRIRLAGAFGSHIDVKYAMILGMIPDCDLAQVSLGRQRRRHRRAHRAARRRLAPTIEELVRRIEKIETAIEPRFQEHFVEAMAIPHTTRDLPEPAQGGAAARRKDCRATRRLARATTRPRLTPACGGMLLSNMLAVCRRRHPDSFIGVGYSYLFLVTH